MNSHAWIVPALRLRERAVASMACVLLTLAVAACGGGGAGSGPLTVAVVTVTPAMAKVMVNEQLQLGATPTDAVGNVLTGHAVAWVSSDTAVATVDATGLVKAIALGQATITATIEGQRGTATVATTTGIHFASVSAGGNHTCGQVHGHAIYCWGDNRFGQLGNGTTTNSATPVLVSGSLPFAYLSVGRNHACAVTNGQQNNLGGPVYCWGDNSSGQLGNGTTTNSTVPVPVLSGLTFIFVVAGGSHTCAWTLIGVTYCWGENSSGQLGNGSTTNSSIPVAITGGLLWSGLSAGSNHTCGFGIAVLGASVSAYCWGDNSDGQLGNGTTASSAMPVPISGPFSGDTLSTGTLFSCGFRGGIGGGPVYCWGKNSSGQLGNGTTTNSATAVSVLGPLRFAHAGAAHVCGKSSDSNTLYCWGDNSSGQLGDGSTISSATPAVAARGLNIGGIFSAGGHHTCTLANVTSDFTGAVYCWGDNTFGQLGNSWTTSSSVPVNVAGPP